MISKKEALKCLTTIRYHNEDIDKYLKLKQYINTPTPLEAQVANATVLEADEQRVESSRVEEAIEKIMSYGNIEDGYLHIEYEPFIPIEYFHTIKQALRDKDREISKQKLDITLINIAKKQLQSKLDKIMGVIYAECNNGEIEYKCEQILRSDSNE